MSVKKDLVHTGIHTYCVFDSKYIRLANQRFYRLGMEMLIESAIESICQDTKKKRPHEQDKGEPQWGGYGTLWRIDCHVPRSGQEAGPWILSWSRNCPRTRLASSRSQAARRNSAILWRIIMTKQSPWANCTTWDARYRRLITRTNWGSPINKPI